MLLIRFFSYVIIQYFFRRKLIMILIGLWIPDGIPERCILDMIADCNATDRHKMYDFKRDILSDVLNVQIAT